MQGGQFNNGMRNLNNPPLSDGDKTNQRKETDQHNKNEVNKMINNQNQKPQQQPPVQKQKSAPPKKLEQGRDKKKENGNKTPNTKKKEIQYVRIFAIQQHYKQSDFQKPVEEIEHIEPVAEGDEIVLQENQENEQ